MFNKKTISYIPPFSYFALFNSVVDIAKKNGKQYKFVDLNKYVYLIYCLYGGKYHKRLLNESFYMYMPHIPLTKSIYNSLNKFGLEENIKSHINKEVIDEKCEEYKRIDEIYNYLKQYKLIDITLLISYAQLENNVKCPIKQIMYDIACEKYYETKFVGDVCINIYKIIKKKCPKIKFNDIELFYSNFIDENENFIKLELKNETKN